MAEPRRPSTDGDLERALRQASVLLRYPVTPPIAAAVRARLETDSDVRRPRWTGWLSVFRWGAAGPLRQVPGGAAGSFPRLALRPALLALIALLIGLFVVSPEARSAVAERLGLRGIAITHVPAVPSPGHLQSLNLGRQITLEQARASVPFRILLPRDIGAPDEVYLLGERPPYVSVVYRARENLPAAATTGVGLLVSQFEGEVEESYVVGKLLPPGASVEVAAVGGARGFWITGAVHGFFFRTPDGHLQSDGSRLAGNTLLWERDGITFRLESALSKDAAIRIATSLQ